MKTFFLTIATLAILSSALVAGEVVERRAAVGELIEIETTTDGGLYFISGKPGRFTIISIGDKTKTIVVTVTGTASNKIAAVVTNLFALVKSPDKKATAIKLAGACESANGLTVDELLADFNKRRTIVLGDRREAWLPFLEGLGALFDRLHDKTKDTPANYKRTLATVGKALRGAAL